MPSDVSALPLAKVRRALLIISVLLNPVASRRRRMHSASLPVRRTVTNSVSIRHSHFVTRRLAIVTQGYLRGWAMEIGRPDRTGIMRLEAVDDLKRDLAHGLEGTQ